MSSASSRKNAEAVEDLGSLLSSATAGRGGVVAPAVPAPAVTEGREGGGSEADPLPEVSRTKRLADLERSIELSVTAFRKAQARHYREVGPALEEIRDDRLYEDAGYESWLDYLDRRWEYSESHAYRFIDMGKVCQALAPLGEKALDALTAESHARELLPALKGHGDDAARRVWVQLTDEPGQKITAARVARVRDALGYGPRDDESEVVEGELVDDEKAAAEQHAAAEHSNRELRTLADELERLGRRLDRVIEQAVSPLDHGAALHDVGRIRKAGRLFNRKAAVPGPGTAADDTTVDVEVIEE